MYSLPGKHMTWRPKAYRDTGEAPCAKTLHTATPPPLLYRTGSGDSPVDPGTYFHTYVVLAYYS